MYAAGLSVGYFIGGCLCGLFPLIVGIAKKRAGLGVLLCLACGAVGFITPAASLALSLVSGIILCVVKKKNAEE